MIERVEVDSSAMDQFIELPWRIYAGDPDWIPPLKSSVRSALGPQNPFFEHGEACYFLARRGGDPVARCAAIHDRRRSDDSGRTGMIGYFEALDDLEASTALLSAAIDWLRDRGVTVAVGPMDFSIFNSYRFKVAGFEESSFLGEPHNPPYYPNLFSSSGFTPCEQYLSWDLDTNDLRTLLQITGPATDSGPSASYGFRPIDMTRFDEELATFYELTLQGFAKHRGYGAISAAEFGFWNQGIKLVLDPDLVTIILAPDGGTAGVGYVVPDHGALLRALDGHLDMAKLPDLLTQHRPTRVLFHTVVLDPVHQHSRVLAAGFSYIIELLLRKGYDGALGTFVRKGRPTIYNHVRAPSREYHLYELAV